MIAALAAVFFAAGIIIVAIAFAAKDRQERVNLARVLDLERADPTQTPQAMIQLMEKAGALADRAFRDTVTTKKLQTALQLAGIKLRPGEFGVLIAGIGVVAGVLVGVLVHSAMLGFVVLVAVPLLAYWWTMRKGRKRRIALENQLPTVLQILAGSLDSGASLLHAMEIVASEGDAPLAPEFARVVAETQVGRPILDSLQAMAERCGSQDLDWTVEAIRIQYTSGGSLSETFRTLAEFMRARVEVRAEVRALSAEARLSGKILTGLPLFIGGFLLLFRRAYVAPLYQTSIGRYMLGAAAAGMIAGSYWMYRIVKKVEV
ncbi:MAG TPA: type II secretion system F family protein [Actinomycetota bacterium]|nr:type II secretion system F family protein [Actinomycetota bacterium]